MKTTTSPNHAPTESDWREVLEFLATEDGKPIAVVDGLPRYAEPPEWWHQQVCDEIEGKAPWMIPPTKTEAPGSVNAPASSVKSETVSEMVASLDQFLAEAEPERDADTHVIESYIKRGYRAVKETGKKVARAEWKLGRQLLIIRARIPHGEWTAYIEKTYDFGVRTATNYMNMALGVSEDFAARNTIMDCYDKAGMIQSKQYMGGIFSERMEDLAIEATELKGRIKRLAEKFKSAVSKVDKRILNHHPEVGMSVVIYSRRLFDGIVFQIEQSKNEIKGHVSVVLPNAETQLADYEKGKGKGASTWEWFRPEASQVDKAVDADKSTASIGRVKVKRVKVKRGKENRRSRKQ